MWPTRREVELLHAALDKPASARAAWDRWRLATGGVPDVPARRLLPLVEWNLRRGAELASPGFVESGVASTLAILTAAAPVLAALREAEIRCLVIKGFALAHLVYPHPALRPMADVDLLVSVRDTEKAAAVLESLGWRVMEPEPAERLPHLHGVTFTRAGAPEMDLHFRALEESGAPGIDEGFFARAVPAILGESTSETLCPADHLLCVCVHGLRWSAVAPIHWVTDAIMLLRRSDDPVAWETLLREAQARRLEVPLGQAFQLLVSEFDAPIPAAVIARLAAVSSPSRRREVAARMKRPSLAGGLFLHWRRLAQERNELSLPGRLLRFPSHLREVWGLNHAWQVPSVAFRKSLVRLARRH